MSSILSETFFFRICVFPLLLLYIYKTYTCVCILNNALLCEVRWCHSDAIFVCRIVCCHCFYFISIFQLDRSWRKTKNKICSSNVRTDIDLFYYSSFCIHTADHFIFNASKYNDRQKFFYSLKIIRVLFCIKCKIKPVHLFE